MSTITVKLGKTGIGKVAIRGNRAQFPRPTAGRVDLTLGLRGDTDARCAATQATLRAVGKKGVLRAP